MGKTKPCDILAVGAHPDDIEHGIGGSVYRWTQMGKRVVILHMTGGEKGTHGSKSLRRREAEAAAKVLGCEVDFLGLKDTEVQFTIEARNRFIRAVRKHRPRVIVAQYHSYPRMHPDHEQSGLIVKNAFPDDAFDTRPEVLRKLASDKHSHWGNVGIGNAAFQVHEHVAQIQSFALLYLLNPGTLTRIWDNELRTPAEEDALTLPEVFQTVADAIYTELDTPLDGAEFTNRRPMVSSLRRNLQAAMTERLMDLALDGRRLPRPVRTLAVGHLWRLNGKLDGVLDKALTGQVDEYTLVHLSDLKERINRALNSVYVTSDLR